MLRFIDTMMNGHRVSEDYDDDLRFEDDLKIIFNSKGSTSGTEGDVMKMSVL